MREGRDWAGEWFSLLEESGEHLHIVYGRVSREAPGGELFYLPHLAYDGLGGFVHLLRQRGYVIPEVPKRARLERPGPWALLRAISAYLNDAGVRHVAWKIRDPERKGRRLTPSWQSLSREESERLARRARSKGVSLNSFLLYHLDRAVSGALLKEHAVNWWMVPTNMRGSLSRARDTAPRSSYIVAKIPAAGSLEELHGNIRTMLRSGYEWGAWWGINLGRWIGKGGMARILRRYAERRHSWIGTFSNLGEWPPSGSSTTGMADGESWFFCPPVTRAHPLGAGGLLWNGHLALALQIHPSLTEDREVSRALLLTWVRALSGGL